MRTKSRIDRLERLIRPREDPEPQKIAGIPNGLLTLDEWKKFCIGELGNSYGSDADPEMKRRWEEWAAKTATLVERRIAQGQL